VAGEDDFVKMAVAAVFEIDLGALSMATHGGNLRAGEQFSILIGEDAGDVFARTALDRPPEGTTQNLEEGMIGKKANEGFGRKFHHALGGRRPDGSGNGQDVIVDEGLGIAKTLEEFADGEIVRAGRDLLFSIAEEADNVGHQLPMARANYIAALTEKAAQDFAGIFHLTLTDGDGEGHIGPRRFDAEMIEQRRQVGIVLFVIDDEAGIDGNAALFGAGKDGVGVAAGAFVFFEKRDLLSPGKQPSC